MDKNNNDHSQQVTSTTSTTAMGQPSEPRMAPTKSHQQEADTNKHSPSSMVAPAQSVPNQGQQLEQPESNKWSSSSSMAIHQAQEDGARPEQARPSAQLLQRPQLRCVTSTTTTTTTSNSNNNEAQSRQDSLCSSSQAEQQQQHQQQQQIGLLYYNREPLIMKDFNAEVRALMDVEQFAHQAELMLDMSETSMDDIIKAMLAKVIGNEQIDGSGEKLDEARQAIFIPNSSMLIARTIQGVSSEAEQEANGQQSERMGLKHDQSWLCALCNLAQIGRRHMVIARFKQPINMGENAHEVRLFVLIVVPSQEKGTKGDVETGRTFATMLADAHFRHLLLRATNNTDFKALMVAKAQQLARSSRRLKNRHKYQLEPAVDHSLSSITLEDDYSSQNDTPGSQHQQQPHPKRPASARSPDSGASDRQRQQRPSNHHHHDDHHHLELSFRKNPRTCKLFELISPTPGSPADQINHINYLKQQPADHNLIIFKQNDQANNNNNNNNNSGVEDVSDGSSSCNKRFAFRAVDMMNSLELNGADRLKTSQAAGGLAKKDWWSGADTCCGGGAGGRLKLEFGKGLWDDFMGRARLYPSDFRDAFVGPPRTIQKTVATIWFLYFGILLPTIAFSSLNTSQTHGHMGDLRKAIIGQAIGGLGFALFGGQPLVIIMTTAPLCLYTKVIHQMCLDYGFHFPAMYAAVGLWNGFFLVIYSLFGFSKLMQWCTRSTEEVFALFIVVAFITDATKDMRKNFDRFYYTPACEAQNKQTVSSMVADDNHHSKHMGSSNANLTGLSSRELDDVLESSSCRRETSLLFLLLMLGTLWLAVTLYKFKKTPYLSAGKREVLADYALPTAVIVMSFVGSFVFDDIYVEKFPPIQEIHFERAQVELLPISGLLTALGLGFTLSLLFFMDQNISAAMVNAPQNRLKKPSAFHYDLFVVGLLNGGLALFGLPMMHGVLPHSPLHVRSLADIEERVDEGHLREVVVNCRETRVTAIVAHILVLASILLIPHPIAYIPRAVLNGLFLYMAVTSLDGLQMFERILLLFTEQNKYPPNHYIRRCPQRKIHKFTILQLFQLLVMCLFGFSPVNIVEMFFPVIILLMIPFRHRIVPKYIEEKYLEALDGKH